MRLDKKIGFAAMLLGCQAAMAGTMGAVVVEDPWTGFYVGGNGGWGWSSFTATETPFGEAATTDIIPQSVSVNTNGPLFGGQIGYNKMFTERMLLGVEVDLDGASIDEIGHSATTSLTSLGQVPSGISTNGYSVHENTYLLGSVRGRIGMTVGDQWKISQMMQHPMLAYFTAGYAWRSINTDVSAAGNVTPFNYSQFANDSFTKSNGTYTVGAGLEMKIANNWSARCEYLYYGFNNTTSHNLYFPNTSPSGAGITSSFSNKDINVIRIGVNYFI